MPLDHFFFFSFLRKIIYHSSDPYLQGLLLENPIGLVSFLKYPIMFGVCEGPQEPIDKILLAKVEVISATK